VPAVFAQVDGDAVRPAEGGKDRRRDRVRFFARGPADRGHVVDVHTEADHGGDTGMPDAVVGSESFSRQRIRAG